LTDIEMVEEIVRSDETFEDRLGHDDHKMFRLPHFQLEASTRTYAVLDRLGYLADSSIGGTSPSRAACLPPALEPWSGRPQDSAFARTHPIRPGATGSCRSPSAPTRRTPTSRTVAAPTNCLREACASGTADPHAYEEVLDEVLDTAIRRHGLAHLFIDPPDAGYGRWTATPSTMPAPWSDG